VVDAVIMGHEKLWKIKAERDRIYALPEMSEKDGVKVAELEMSCWWAHQVVKFQDQRIKPVPIVHAVSNLVRFRSLVH
jgi:hypothetical protein